MNGHEEEGGGEEVIKMRKFVSISHTEERSILSRENGVRVRQMITAEPFRGDDPLPVYEMVRIVFERMSKECYVQNDYGR